MIEKLVRQKLTIAGKEYEYPDTTALVGKINELADAVNVLQENQNTYWTDIAELKKELQTRPENVQPDAETRPENVQPDAESRPENVQPDAESRPENVQDKFAEQRKCICKLCWFWNDDKADKVIGILTGVFDEADRPFERSINQTLYKHCEPVKPDDDIIYKGGSNE